MSTVTGTYTVAVSPATPLPNPLKITPASGSLPAETEGQAVSGVVATVSGGVPPYNYQITGQPAGVTFGEVPSADGVTGDQDIVLQGAPAVGSAAGSPYTVSIVVTDSATPAATASVSKQIG